jgi:hypothetical protein
MLRFEEKNVSCLHFGEGLYIDDFTRDELLLVQQWVERKLKRMPKREHANHNLLIPPSLSTTHSAVHVGLHG